MTDEVLEIRCRVLIEQWRKQARYLRGLRSASRDGQMDEYYWRREAAAFDARADELQKQLETNDNRETT